MNTYQQIAAKLGRSVSFVRGLVRNREIEVEDFGHRTKRITDKAFDAYRAKHTRRAIG